MSRPITGLAQDLRDAALAVRESVYQADDAQKDYFTGWRQHGMPDEQLLKDALKSAIGDLDRAVTYYQDRIASILSKGYY